MNRRKKNIATKLGAYVRQRYTLSTEARQELFGILTDCVRLMDGDHAPDADGVDVDVNIIPPIVRGVKGLLRDILGNSADEPFTVQASPHTDLPADVEARLVQGIAQRLPEVAPYIQSTEQLDRFLQIARNSAVLAMNREGTRRARKMEAKVKDDMHDAQWASAFDDFLMNFCIYPYAVIKSPSPQVIQWKEWAGDRLVFSARLVDMCENISPFDFGWSPNATSIATAEFLWERRRIGADELLDYAGEDTYDSEMIDHIFDKLPDGFDEPYDNGGTIPPVIKDVEGEVTDAVEPAQVGYYDAIGFYGRIKGEFLKEFGIEVDDERRWYEAEVWTVNDIPFKVALNPDPAGNRPFQIASYDAAPGQIAGKSPALKLQDVQRVCRAAIRALVRNMALSSGVIGEVQADRLADDDDPRVLQAHIIRLVNASRAGNAGPAYTFHDVNSHAAELVAVFDKFHALGYEMLGIPRIAFGGTDGLGTIGRTSGGISMVMNQASKTLKDALRSVESGIIVPVVQGFIDRNNMYSDDETIKGDARAYARGVSGILERESQRERLAWALQSIGPMVQAGLVPPEAATRLLYALFQANGIDTEGILPDFDAQAALGADVQAGGLPPGGAPQAQPTPSLEGPSGATLDGRSANAINAIDNMNSLG